MNKSFSIKTLGCKLNQYESGRISGALKVNGWTEVPYGAPCDAVIINTCTVTDNSDRKCRNYIRRASEFGKVYVTGCLAQRDHESLLDIEGIAAIYSNSQKDRLITDIEPEAISSSCFSLNGRTRSFLKIQDGCDGKCSYCIVPAVRGLPKSRPTEEIINEARMLIDSGSPEIVLTGITIGKYYFNGLDLADIAEKIISIPGNFRLRITSIEPLHLTNKLAELFSSEKIAPHIHLPLQSGSDNILVGMRRPYNVSEFFSSIEKIRRVCPEIAIGTDIMVGFPGESDEDFSKTLKTASESEFSYVHQFTYSPRGGTDSSTLPVINHKILSERSAALKQLSRQMTSAYRSKFIGKKLHSVIEKGYALSGNYIHMRLTKNICEKISYVKLIDSSMEPEGEPC